MKWFPAVLLAPIMLAGCSTPPEILDIGTMKQSVPFQQRVAISRLAGELKSNPQTTLFLIRWVFDNKGHKSNSELAYNKNAATLTLDKSRYSNVTEQVIDSAASHTGTLDNLPQYGATKEAG